MRTPQKPHCKDSLVLKLPRVLADQGFVPVQEIQSIMFRVGGLKPGGMPSGPGHRRELLCRS